MAERPLRLAERVEARLARLLMRLPPAVQVALSRRAAVVVDGEALHPELQLILALREVKGARGLLDGSPERARRRLRRDGQVHAGPPCEVGAVRELTIAGPGGPLRLRHYAPPGGSSPRPLLVFLHGGGFVLGDLETHDAACRTLCRGASAHVLAVEYRLAPEHPFPAGLEDARAAFAWAAAHAAELGADPARVAVGGDSAGANLATVVSRLAARAGGPVPALQLLLYPAVGGGEFASLSRFAEGFLLTRRDIREFGAHYFGSADPADPRLNPALAPDLHGLPPALVVTAGFDPLRDEGEAYAALLERAGNRVRHLRARGMVHGFINMTGLSPGCRAAFDQVVAALREELG